MPNLTKIPVAGARVDTEANFESKKRELNAGELVVTSDTHKLVAMYDDNGNGVQVANLDDVQDATAAAIDELIESDGTSVTGITVGESVQQYDYEHLDHKLDKTAIAPLFDSSQSYAVGDCVIHDGQLYKCRTAGSGAWDASRWTLSSVVDVAASADALDEAVTELKGDLEQVTEVVSTEPRTIYTPIPFNLLGETRTQNGLNIVQNTNGTVRVYGTANALTVIPFKDASSNQLSFNLSTGETYRLQGCPANGSNSTYRLDLRTIGDQQEIIATDTGSGVVFTVNTTKSYYPYIRIASGATVDQTFSLEVALRSIIEDDILSAIDMVARDGLQDSNTHLTKIDLLQNDIPDTVQNYTFSSGSVSQVTHVRNNDVIRTDSFIYGTGIITETRTLYTGESMTIVTNLATLETTVTYSGV